MYHILVILSIITPRVFNLFIKKIIKKEILGSLSAEVISLKKPINVVMVKSLVEVLKFEPFLDGLGHLFVIIDLDGVLCIPGDTTHENIAKLVALKTIAANSDFLTIDSSRLRISYKSRRQDGNVIHFPFYNQDSENFLSDIVSRFNPNCEVDSKVGFFRKRRKGYAEEMDELVRENLEQGRKVVFIGSNRNDISVAKKIVTNIDDSGKNKVYIFNTGYQSI